MGFFNDLTGGLLDTITGKDAAKASRRAGNAQQRAEAEAREQLVELNAPFVELGTNAVPGLQSFVDDPTGASFLEGNPMFQAAVDNAGDRVANVQAAGGKFNSGGTIDQLFQNYLAIGDNFVNSGFNRAYQPVALGQNAANFQGVNVANSITSGASAQAAGQVGAANAKQDGINNIIKLIGAFV